MNVKLAKQLRREVGYHPTKSEPAELLPTFSGGTRNGIFTGMILDPKSKKAEYRNLKKEVKNGER